MMSPFFVLTQEVNAVDLALRQASSELKRSRSKRRSPRATRRGSDRRW